ncbi:MAG: hypothetical protein KatS3mg010_1431 [Acidimicrobiia bacterium]|nr:MAG: hypothetical protein KatS3mg010_1431 [Acidimicrobiia bacterium]
MSGGVTGDGGPDRAVERHLGLDADEFVAHWRATRPAGPPGTPPPAGLSIAPPRCGAVTAVLGPRLGATRFGRELARLASPVAALVDGRAAGPSIAGAEHVIGAARRRARGRAVVVVTTEPRVAALADRVIVMDGRAPIADGPPAAVLDDAIAAAGQPIG